MLKKVIGGIGIAVSLASWLFIFDAIVVPSEAVVSLLIAIAMNIAVLSFYLYLK